MVSGDNDDAVPGQDPLPDVDPVDSPEDETPATATATQERPAPDEEQEPEPEPAPEAAAPEPARRAAEPSPGPRPRPRAGSIAEGVLTVEDHLEKVLRGLGPLAPYDQPLVESLGLPLFADYVSPVDLPRYDQALVDGYAVAAGDATSATADAPTVAQAL